MSLTKIQDILKVIVLLFIISTFIVVGIEKYDNYVKENKVIKSLGKECGAAIYKDNPPSSGREMMVIAYYAKERMIIPNQIMVQVISSCSKELYIMQNKVSQ